MTELDREFFQDQGIQLAPGPKELMNTQRFYLYLNMTKPRELLCLSFCQSDSQGKALSPAFLINNIREMFPEMEIRQCGEAQDSMELLELPGISLDYLLKGLAGESYRDDAVFQELYSWYLQSPEYRTLVKRLTEVSFSERPSDMIGKTVAGILYGEVSPYSATRLERFAACAFAHFLQYGLKVTERAEYEFRAMDMGNVMHMALEKFAAEVRKEGLDWADLTEEERNRIIDDCLDQVSADYGNTVLKSSARNEYMIERTRRILRRTVWALQEQLKHGEFRPEGFEVKFEGGRIDRVDIMEEPENNRVYVKVIDYKTGNTSFDMLALYHGLQLQLMIYLDGALKVEQRKYPDREIVPAGIFYYNVKDPMIQEKIHIPDTLADIFQRIIFHTNKNIILLSHFPSWNYLFRSCNNFSFIITVKHQSIFPDTFPSGSTGHHRHMRISLRQHCRYISTYTTDTDYCNFFIFCLHVCFPLSVHLR